MDINSQLTNIQLSSLKLNTKVEDKTDEELEVNPICTVEDINKGSDQDVLNSLEVLSQYNKATVRDTNIKNNKSAIDEIRQSIESRKYSAEDMVDNDEVKVTKSKKQGVVAIQVQGDPNDFVYPSTSTPNKEILVKDANGYPIGKLHYDENGNLTKLESLADSLIGFDAPGKISHTFSDYVQAYSAEDMVNNDKVKVTKSKKQGVVAIQVQGDPNDFVYPSTSTPNKEILVQDASSYPIGKLHYDENGQLEEFEPLVDGVMSFEEPVEEEESINKTTADSAPSKHADIAETGKPFVDKISQATYYIAQLLPNVKTARAKAASIGGPMKLAEHYRKNLKKYHNISLTSADMWNIMYHLFGNPSKKAIK